MARGRAQTLLVLFSVDDLTGFELTYIMELPDPWGLIAVWGFVLPVAYLVSTALTNLVLRDFLILKARRPQPQHHQPQHYFSVHRACQCASGLLAYI